MDDQVISDIISIFTERQWKEFIRAKLRMAKDEITMIEQERLEFNRFKLEVVKKWEKSEPARKDPKMLRELKHEFFCGGWVSCRYDFHGKKGQVLIISNSDSNHGEAEIMKELWEGEFECILFKNEIQKNQNAVDMKSLCCEMASTNSPPAYFVVVVITNVQERERQRPQHLAEYLTASDGEIVETNDIKQAFRNVHTSGSTILQEVPKIFIFKGCRGPPFRNKEGQSNRVNEAAYDTELIPEMSDMLCIYPPISETTTDNGNFQGAINSWRFIEVLDGAFRKYGKKKHVVDIVARLNRQMASTDSRDGKPQSKRLNLQMASMHSKDDDGNLFPSRGATSCVSSLRKQLFLRMPHCLILPSSVNMIATEHLTEFLNIFHGCQWEDFARTELKVQTEDHQRLTTLQNWSKDKSDPMSELRKLRHHFFCDDEMSSTEAKTRKGEEIKTKQSYVHEKPEANLKSIPFTENISPPQDEDVYSSSGERYVLIINNSFDPKRVEIVSKNFRPRTPGCHKDNARMLKLWKDKLRCKLYQDKVHEDKPAEEMMKIIKDMAGEIDAGKCAYLVIIIMSHGGSGPAGEYLCGMEISDRTSGNLRVTDIKKVFYDEKFEGIPKLFIFHGCRGELIDSGVKANVQTAAVGFSEISVSSVLSDIICMYPSAPQYSAYDHHLLNGSWLIQEIYRIFKRNYRTMHVADMLTLVNHEMTKKTDIAELKKGNLSVVKTTSEYVSFLTKDFYLDNVPT